MRKKPIIVATKTIGGILRVAAETITVQPFEFVTCARYVPAVIAPVGSEIW